MKLTLNIFLILISTSGYAQNNSASDVFRKIIDYEIGKGKSGIYVRCEKTKTSFNLKDFKEQTGVEVPENILNEIEINTTNSTDGIWNTESISQLNYGLDFIKSKKCLTKDDAEKLFKNTKRRQNIVSVSEPIFDNNYENCVISVSYHKFTGSAYGQTYFLKKVYGVWTVVVEFDQWIT